MKQVDILLSTYNGEKYIDELIESVMQQTYSNVRLLIRDDGSKDCTLDKILFWRERHPDKIVLICDDKGNLGVTKSMFDLLKESAAPYMIFCDQDDVWFPDKVAKLVKGIQLKEKEYPNIPIIVHCEAYTTDEKLNLLGKSEEKSLQSYQASRNKMQVSFANLLLCNPIQGASMIFNSMLREELKPVFDVKIKRDLIYDSLVASVCSIRGRVFFLNRSLMYYRQHANNIVGANKLHLSRLRQYTAKEQDEIKAANYLLVNRTKCDVLKRCYSSVLDDRQRKILNHFLRSPNDWNNFFKLDLQDEFTWKQIMIMMCYRVE